jgi:hypothetical protein
LRRRVETEPLNSATTLPANRTSHQSRFNHQSAIQSTIRSSIDNPQLESEVDNRQYIPQLPIRNPQ